MLGKKDLYIDFAGTKPGEHRIHRSLARLQTGDTVTLERDKTGQVLVLDRERVQVACRSKSTACGWPQHQLQQVDEVRVLGMVARGLDDSAPEFRDSIAVPA